MSGIDPLADELSRLGRALTVAPPREDLAERVLADVASRSVVRRAHRRLWLARWRRRLIALLIVGLLIGLGLTPPVRAVIRDWLGFGGVLIRTAPPPPPVSAPPATPTATPLPTPSDQIVTLAEARRLVDFTLGVPADLGRPDQVTVSSDRRVVGMTWGEGPSALRLDQFDGTISWVFVKQVQGPVRFTDVGDRDAIWLAEPHPIAYVDRDGREHTEAARLSGPCLIWERGATDRPVTARLEGAELTRQRATAIAESVR